jgi:predicted RNase H-like HicB family nuclease
LRKKDVDGRDEPGHDEARLTMAHYVAIIEDAGPDHAIGVWFPDLPGCTSGGDDIDEALRNAPEALEL